MESRVGSCHAGRLRPRSGLNAKSIRRPGLYCPLFN